MKRPTDIVNWMWLLIVLVIIGGIVVITLIPGSDPAVLKQKAAAYAKKADAALVDCVVRKHYAHCDIRAPNGEIVPLSCTEGGCERRELDDD